VDRGKEYLDRGRAQWDEFVNQGRQFVSEKTGRVSSAVEAGRQAFQSSSSDSPDKPA
jgi:hypothetical protein